MRRPAARSTCPARRCCGPPCCGEAPGTTCWSWSCTTSRPTAGLSASWSASWRSSIREEACRSSPSSTPTLPSGSGAGFPASGWSGRSPGGGRGSRPAPEEIPLPADQPRTAALSNRGGRCCSALPLPPGLATVSREQQATLFMVLLAAFATLLSRWSAEEDLVVGSPVANRNRVEVEGLIGFFVNMLALRVDLSGQPSFGALLARVRETTLAAYAHQDLPFEKLVEELAAGAAPRPTPLFQVSCVLQNAPFEAVEIPGLSLNPMPLEARTAKFDLSLALEQAGRSSPRCSSTPGPVRRRRPRSGSWSTGGTCWTVPPRSGGPDLGPAAAEQRRAPASDHDRLERNPVPLSPRGDDPRAVPRRWRRRRRRRRFWERARPGPTAS